MHTHTHTHTQTGRKKIEKNNIKKLRRRKYIDISISNEYVVLNYSHKSDKWDGPWSELWADRTVS